MDSFLDLAIYLNYNFDPFNPSVRIRRLNIRKPLRQIGINADTIYRYEDLMPYKNILISCLDQETLIECRELKKLGKKLYFCHSEHLWGLPFQSEIFNLCDYIVCCSTKLAELTQPLLKSSFTKCVVIQDMAEPSSILHSPKKTDKLSCVYTGMGGNAYLARRLKPLINSLGMELSIISEHSDADIRWNLETYLSDMAKFDIAICPQNVEAQPAKSNVKLTTAMSLGLPTVSSPNPAYLEIVNQGVNGFIAKTDKEWADCLTKLKDVDLRKKISQEALKTAEAFSPQAIALKWKELLSIRKTKVALINNTLCQKYMSYGDLVLEKLRLDGYEVQEFRYEDIDILPENFDLYLFIEVRYFPEDIPNKIYPKVLYTKEHQKLDNLAHFDLIVSENPELVDRLNTRGFVNVFYNKEFNSKFIFENSKKDFVEARKKHNIQLHTAHINSFYHLQLPETRWTGLRDKQHIDFTVEHCIAGSKVLDIGSADGWLATYLAKEKREVSALEFVDRGIEWTKQQASRFNVNIDIRKGCFEDVCEIFSDKKFDCILGFEICEHLDFLKLPNYLAKMEKLLNPSGKILISLPSQPVDDNVEHLWTPTAKLINKLFADKSNYEIRWIPLPDSNVPGNWFIKYQI